MSQVGQTFPNVPNVPGVPNIPRNPFSPIALPLLLTADSLDTSAASAPAQWGIFSNGQPVIVADNVVSFEYRQDFALADYQIEQGGFETYDKVQRPYDVRLQFSAGGSEANRLAFLASVEAIVDDTNLYDVYMPERHYSDANVRYYDYKRESKNGLGLFIINIYLSQVRADVQQQFSSSGSSTSPANPSNTQDPGSNAFVDNGVVQPVTVATLQPPVSATSPGATGIAGDPNAVAPPITLSPNVPTTTNVPIMTPANQAAGFSFGAAPELSNGVLAQPFQTATQNTFTLDQFSGGTNEFNPTAGTMTLIPAGQAPQSLGWQ